MRDGSEKNRLSVLKKSGCGAFKQFSVIFDAVGRFLVRFDAAAFRQRVK